MCECVRAHISEKKANMRIAHVLVRGFVRAEKANIIAHVLVRLFRSTHTTHLHGIPELGADRLERGA